MALAQDRRVWVCPPGEPGEGDYRRVDVRYAGEPCSVLVFRLGGVCRAYRNRCVHMPRALDCEQDMIFDSTRRYLRCSMHGIVYDPETGASLSTLCQGERLTAVRLVEDTGGVWLADKRVRPGIDGA